ncbi:MAG: hypothetical protein HC897_20595 [Thermoanaerobaculia bacterium]|nr:hypothetical protein [Thermoanaerobaculia bacterium]
MVELCELPNDVETLKGIVEAERRELVGLRLALSRERLRVEHYLAEIAAFRRRLFGRTSEKLSDEELRQQSLFNEAEQAAEVPPAEESASVSVAAHHARAGAVDLCRRTFRGKRSCTTSGRTKRSVAADIRWSGLAKRVSRSSSWFRRVGKWSGTYGRSTPVRPAKVKGAEGRQ